MVGANGSHALCLGSVDLRRGVFEPAHIPPKSWDIEPPVLSIGAAIRSSVCLVFEQAEPCVRCAVHFGDAEDEVSGHGLEGCDVTLLHRL